MGASEIRVLVDLSPEAKALVDEILAGLTDLAVKLDKLEGLRPLLAEHVASRAKDAAVRQG